MTWPRSTAWSGRRRRSTRSIRAQTFLQTLAADPSHNAANSRCPACWRRKATSKPRSESRLNNSRPIPPTSPALEQLASILSDVGDASRLEPVVQRLVKEAPKNTWAHYYAASLFFIQDRLDLSLQAARNAVAIDPANAKAQNLLGACLASMGQNDAARAAFESSIKADPKEPGTYTNLATLELQTGQPRSRAEVLRRGTDDRSEQPGRTRRTGHDSRQVIPGANPLIGRIRGI